MIHLTISSVDVPGVNTSLMPAAFRNDTASEDSDVVGVLIPEQLTDAGQQGVMGAGQDREADTVHILLNGGRNNLLRSLVQPGVNDLETCVAEGTGDDLGTAVVTVQARLSNKYPKCSFSHC